jgi:hypothetical protein
MHAARPARLRPSAKPNFLQQRAHFERDPSYVGPLNTGPGVEIDA